ncbi:NAD-dependent protein deacetylase [Melissospora conviva]|uniref:NAD-dependent protein deacetylase n=1 Tax=Melissospora conviva TaxID=3388432 RepID=UPI003B7B231A
MQRIEALAERVAGGGVVVLSGAGLSTESGIPDYRGPSGAARRRHTPMTYQAFVADAQARQRYWARSHLGWRAITGAAPNDGHRAVARLHRDGLVTAVVTQNVDGLHTAAGCPDVIELHGNLARVRCLGCGQRSDRAELDRRLRAANPHLADHGAQLNPDGDVDLPAEAVAAFRTVDCVDCGGILKPDVVFFGENVPADRVARCFDLVERARLLLVLGSSLTVFSGRRFVTRAAALGIEVAIVNQGPTRGDGCATLSLDAPLGVVLPELCRHVEGTPSPPTGTGPTPPPSTVPVSA